MIELLRKTVYAGIGASLVTRERVESVLQDFVEKGKLSADEAREAASRLAEDSKKEYEDAQESLKDLFEDLLARSPVVEKKEFKALEKRVAQLEKALEEANASTD